MESINSLNQLFQEVKILQEKNNEEKEKNRFNVFTALYKHNEEVRLHSRFISYLLSPISGHDMKDVFLKHFVYEILKITKDEFNIENCEVIPNEFNKKEENEIDILIKNKKYKQAIVIENKIDAKESNHFNKEEGYKGQLERYFNELKDKGYQESKIHVFYLTKQRRPSDYSLGVLKDKQNWRDCLYYGNEIREWLQKCIESVASEKENLKEFIQQYLNLINKMTHNDLTMEEKIELKNKISKNIESTKYLNNNFKHVKWHTIDDFWNELKKQLEKEFNNVRFYPDKNSDFHNIITLVSHQNKNINHGILFNIDSEDSFYISGLGDLSWGIHEKGWFAFENKDIENINFSDFSSNNTYNLIDTEKMKTTVKLIIDEILEEKRNDFINKKEK